MYGRVVALYRYPVKGFTAERLRTVLLESGRHFPHDRLFAVERGPCGFDPGRPEHVSKWRFTVLANHPKLARTITAWDAETGLLTVGLGDRLLRFDLLGEAGAEGFARWLETFLGPEEEARPLRLVAAGPSHRFTDDVAGYVSVTNLASLRDLSARTGRAIDPLRLRANVHVEGWAPGSEIDWPPGTRLQLGGATVEVIKPIPRCIATHVDPSSGERDLDFIAALREHYGHVLCGVYVRTVDSGVVTDGAVATGPAAPSSVSARKVRA